MSGSHDVNNTKAASVFLFFFLLHWKLNLKLQIVKYKSFSGRFSFVLLTLLSALSGSRGGKEAEGIFANKIISEMATPTFITLQFFQNLNVPQINTPSKNNCWSTI